MSTYLVQIIQVAGSEGRVAQISNADHENQEGLVELFDKSKCIGVRLPLRSQEDTSTLSLVRHIVCLPYSSITCTILKQWKVENYVFSCLPSRFEECISNHIFFESGTTVRSKSLSIQIDLSILALRDDSNVPFSMSELPPKS